MKRIRLDGQSLAAIGVLTVLGAIAVVTAQSTAPAYEPYASTDYRAGGFRAWASLLEREEIAAGRFTRRPIELDGRIDTLISAQSAVPPAAASVRTAADIAALGAWVRGGGRLVYIGRAPGRAPDEDRALELPFFVPGVGARPPLAGLRAKSIGTLERLGTNHLLFVERPGTVLLRDGNGDIAVRYPLGRGEVDAVVDGAPFTNAAIARAGNARLAYLLALPRHSGGLVAFDDGLHGALVDRPWYRALPLPLRVTLSIAALALVLALVSGALRGAPPMRLAPKREPTSEEFVAALAALHERIGARTAARDVLVRDALAAAARNVGLREDAPAAELVERLGGATAPADVRRLARSLETPAATDADLLASAQLAYHVRKDGTDDGYGDRTRAAFAGRARARHRR